MLFYKFVLSVLQVLPVNPHFPVRFFTDLPGGFFTDSFVLARVL